MFDLSNSGRCQQNQAPVQNRLTLLKHYVTKGMDVIGCCLIAQTDVLHHCVLASISHTRKHADAEERLETD
jgi:hypothetical protein